MRGLVFAFAVAVGLAMSGAAEAAPRRTCEVEIDVRAAALSFATGARGMPIARKRCVAVQNAGLQDAGIANLDAAMGFATGRRSRW